MNKEFVTYEQALALKELGFDEPCLAFYSPKKELHPVMQEPAKDTLIELLYSQVIDLTMMSKIELGDDVIEEIKRLRAIIDDKNN